MPMAPSTRLGPYEVTTLIGTGGMGEVYRARDPRLGRDVAIKILPRQLATAPDRLRRFEQEARTVAALNHPNILALFEIGTHEGAPYIVTELLEGESLQDRLKGAGLTLRRAVETAVQIAQGLAAAHEKGVIHRDVKPANVFLTRDGHVKILDFGIAKLGARPGAEGLAETPTVAEATEAGSALGTVGYMAPEQLRGQMVDQRADIFSFGCVLYEMLSGHSPFRKGTDADTVSAILHEDPPPLAVQGREIPAALRVIVDRCLEKRPDDRFSSAHDLALALRAVVESPATGRPSTEPASKSIVVLPFENLSPDPENAYFADGLTEELIADLSKVRALRVISRTSAMLLRGSKKDVPTIARELNVRYVLEGSVRRAGQSLRITAQLIDAANDAHVWAEKYTGTLEDVFDMQERVSRAIVEALRLELSPQERQGMAERPIPNLSAYECYLKARREIWLMAERSLDKAMEYLEEGLRALPDNPLLLAGVAYVHLQRVNIGAAQEDNLQKAAALATRALELSPDLPQGHLVLGALTGWRPGMMRTAINHLERVLAADPNDRDVLVWMGLYYAHLGRLAEAAAMGERVIAIDPMSPASYVPSTLVHWHDGRLDLALQVWDRIGKVDPSWPPFRPMRLFLLISAGRHEEAVAEAEPIEKDEQFTIFHRIALLWRYALVGEREKALSFVPPEVLPTCRRDLENSWLVACAYVMLGDADSALDWLGNAIDLGFLNHHYLGEIDPVLAPLRSDPRFQALMVRAREKRAEFEAHR
jgi:serine/threonine protein kinase